MTPPRRACAGCGTPIDGYRASLPNVVRCVPCQYAKRHPARPVAAPTRQCAMCGADISDRHLLARYCHGCTAQLRRQSYREQAHRRRSVARAGQQRAQCQAARDLALEAEIDRHLAAIRARGGYTLTDDIIWARRSDPVQAVAPEPGDWPSDQYHSEASREKNRRACRARHARVKAQRQKGRAA